MRDLPAGWPPPSDDAVNDDVVVDIPDAPWLSGPQALDSFELKRDLVGSLLPKQVRLGSGLSVADGSCTFAYEASDGAPWRLGAAKIVPEGLATMYAEALSGATIPLGTFLVDEVRAKLSSPELDVRLIDAKIAQRKPNSFPGYLNWLGTAPAEPAWVVDTLARSLGFFSTPAPVASCVLSVPMSGAIISEYPYKSSEAGTAPEWDHHFGTIGPATAFDLLFPMGAAVFVADTFITATVEGVTTFSLHDATQLNPAQVRVDHSGNLSVRNNSSASYVAGSYAPGDNADHPQRVEIECQRLGAPSAWTGFRARARSASTSAWGPWVTQSTTVTSPHAGFTRLGVAGTRVIGIQVTTTSDAGVWAVPNATIFPLGSTIDAAQLPPDKDAWAGIQEVVAAHFGAAWVDGDRNLTVRDFAWLRGARPTDGTLEVLDDLDDLDWSIINQDMADRVEIVYRPVDLQMATANSDPTVWAATEVYEVPAGQSIEIIADGAKLTAPYAAIGHGIIPEWSTSWPATKYSRWNARWYRDGSGAQPPWTAMTHGIRQLNSTQYVITLTNHTAATLYTVNGSGEPVLIFRAFCAASQSAPVVVASGVSAEDATNLLKIDLGVWCQDDGAARNALTFVTGQTRAPSFTVSSVTVPFDWRRELGDIYTLTHADVELNARVLVTGISISGRRGDYTQKLDLVLLDQSIYGFNQAWLAANPTATIADFNTVWDGVGLTIGDFNLDPFKTA